MNLQFLDSVVPAGLPLGFADQVMELQMKLQEEETLQLIQILSQMYKIAVDFYIDNDVKKAAYFQRKLNNLVVKAIHASSIEQKPKTSKKNNLPRAIIKQIDKYKLCQKTYLKTLVQNNQKQQVKIRRHVHDDLQKQEQNLEGRRMLRRVKSQQRLFKK